jgi:hypothetical protein
MVPEAPGQASSGHFPEAVSFRFVARTQRAKFNSSYSRLGGSAPKEPNSNSAYRFLGTQGAKFEFGVSASRHPRSQIRNSASRRVIGKFCLVPPGLF